MIERKSKLIQKSLQYINSHLSIKLHVKEIAKELFVAPRTLSKHFREEVGMSIGQYIDQRVQFEAEILLTDGDMTIEQISEKLGFCDRFYFTHKFKEKKYKTPVQYRKESRIYQ